MMRIQSILLALAVLLATSSLAGQSPTPVDTSKLGPQVGAVVPSFSGVDQFGKSHTLASAGDTRGAEGAGQSLIRHDHRRVRVSGVRRQGLLQPGPCAAELCGVN